MQKVFEENPPDLGAALVRAESPSRGSRPRASSVHSPEKPAFSGFLVARSSKQATAMEVEGREGAVGSDDAVASAVMAESSRARDSGAPFAVQNALSTGPSWRLARRAHITPLLVAAGAEPAPRATRLACTRARWTLRQMS